jgi:hypothetical protein
VADVSIKSICGNGHNNGFLMSIHSDKKCARFGHVDLRSHV